MRLLLIFFTLALAAASAGDPLAQTQTITVAAGGDLQAALKAAHPGMTILLERGATYVGNFLLPAAGPDADGDRVITLRTKGDADLPAEGTRIGPDAAPRLAKLQSPNGSPALATAAGARGWRLELLEVLPTRNGSNDIIRLGDGSSEQQSLDRVPSHFVLDRLYIHGDAEKGQKRGIALNAADVTISHSYISDIKAVGQDSQAIGGWNGPGNYVIEDNYLEAAGENVMFGGADPAIPNLTPTHIVVRNNLMTKPLAWRDARPPWSVKNIFELKNARDVLIEHNVMEHCWRQAQAGYAILFTVRNQDGACAWCQIEHVEFRGNFVRDVAAAMQILGTDPNHPSRQTNGIVVRDNVFDGIDGKQWGGDGYFLQLSDAPRDVTIDHNTIVQQQSGGLVKIVHGVAQNVSITNNIAMHGNYGIIGSNHGVGADSINAYLPGATVTHNVLAGGRAASYPSGNLFPSVDELRKQFVDFAAHDYRLTPSSAWRKAGMDRRSLGANLEIVAHPD